MASEQKQTVYQLIAAVSAEISKTGIAKTRANADQKYKFRGIDEVLNTLSPILSKHGLIVLPRMVHRDVSERASRSGGTIFSVVVDAEFDFVSAADGSKHVVRTFGEAMDSADKATNKAMSAAYKYAAFLTFCIPIEGMAEDADADHHDVAAKVPKGYEDFLIDYEATADNGLEALRAAFKAAKPEYKDWLRHQDKAKQDAIVERATKVSESVLKDEGQRAAFAGVKK
jgi:hypothetical protein